MYIITARKKIKKQATATIIIIILSKLTMINEEGKTIYIKDTSEPSKFNVEIYHALGLSEKPLKRVKTIV